MSDSVHKTYALYHGDEFVAVGTIKEISHITGKSIKTLYFFGSPAYQKKHKGVKARYILIKVEEDESE